jgi:hypothetical protein
MKPLAFLRVQACDGTRTLECIVEHDVPAGTRLRLAMLGGAVGAVAVPIESVGQVLGTPAADRHGDGEGFSSAGSAARVAVPSVCAALTSHGAATSSPTHAAGTTPAAAVAPTTLECS